MLTEPRKFHFDDDGAIPNSKLPLLLYRDVIPAEVSDPAEWLEQRFAENNWTRAWKNGVYAFHHYHSTTHEVLGVYSGKAILHLGGESGEKIEVAAGDVIIIPAGVGHKNMESEHLGVVGAYPNGREWDLLKGEKGERPQADENIRQVPKPGLDPLFGKERGLPEAWK